MVIVVGHRRDRVLLCRLYTAGRYCRLLAQKGYTVSISLFNVGLVLGKQHKTLLEVHIRKLGNHITYIVFTIQLIITVEPLFCKGYTPSGPAILSFVELGVVLFQK